MRSLVKIGRYYLQTDHIPPLRNPYVADDPPTCCWSRRGALYCALREDAGFITPNTGVDSVKRSNTFTSTD